MRRLHFALWILGLGGIIEHVSYLIGFERRLGRHLNDRTEMKLSNDEVRELHDALGPVFRLARKIARKLGLD